MTVVDRINPDILAAIIAMSIGVVGTSIIHLSKGVMRLGLLRLRDPREAKRRSRAIYTFGVLMNFTNPLWVILANRFAPTVFYTSMYGLGLLPLLLFTRSRLKEHLHAKQYLGIFTIVVGTLLVGIGNLRGGRPSLFGANTPLLVSVALGWLILAPVGSLLIRGRSIRLQEFFFGLFAGGLAALEALVKGVAQAGPVENSFLPQSPGGWWLFGASFLGAAGAFGMIQWSYLRHCRASVMGSIYDVAYVAIPLILTAAIVDGAGLGAWKLAGIAVLGLGVLIIRGAPAAKIAYSQM